MADLHIDDFYKDVAKIFLRLYSIFPRKTTLFVGCAPRTAGNNTVEDVIIIAGDN